MYKEAARQALFELPFFYVELIQGFKRSCEVFLLQPGYTFHLNLGFSKVNYISVLLPAFFVLSGQAQNNQKKNTFHPPFGRFQNLRILLCIVIW
jgi:hypothetical protein